MTLQAIYKHSNRLIATILLISLTFTILSCINGVSADPATIYVNDSSGNDSWDGQYAEWQTGTTYGPKKTIQSGISTVTDGGTVNIANGKYEGEGNTNITIDKNMAIKGQRKEGTIVNGTNEKRIFFISKGMHVEISDLTLANGNTTLDGGAIHNAEGVLTVKNCIFTGNTAYDGGAISNHGTLNIDNSTFTGNTAHHIGGAILNTGPLTVDNSHFIGNKAYWDGGAIYSFEGTLTVDNCTFTDNAMNRNGGAIYIGSGALNVTGSNFENNTALNNGGAIYSYNSTLNVDNSTFTGNSANQGGAILNSEGTLNVNSCTFIDNIGRGSGGAIWSHKGTLNVDNSTFTGNTTHGVGGAILNSKGTLNVDNSTFTGNSAGIDNVTGHGGAILNAEGTLNVNSCTFTDNTAYGDGGAINNYGPSTINSCIFTYNVAKEVGGAIYNFLGPLTVQFCRIVGNTPNDIYESNNTPTNIEYNWWGSNDNPSGRVIGATGVTSATVSTWLVLTETANPGTISTGETSTITVDLLHDQNGVYHDPAGGHVPDGIESKFTSSIESLNPSSNTMINGQATSTFTASAPGTANITATVDNQQVSTQVIINKAPTNLSMNDVSAVNGEEVSVTATLTDKNNKPITGKIITFSMDGTNIGSATTGSDGKAAIKYETTQTVGDHTITAEFAGDNEYGGTKKEVKLAVNKKPTNLEINNVNGVNGETVNMTATLTDNKNNPLAGKTIAFNVDGTNIGNATTSDDGKATISYKPNSVGDHEITAEFSGDNEYRGGKTEKRTLKVDKSPTNLVVNNSSVNGRTANVTVTLTNQNNDPLVGKTINFNINGVNIGNAITNSNGKAKFSYKLNNAGDYTIIAGFVEDDGYLGSQNEVTLHVESSSDNSQTQINNENSETIPKSSEPTVKAATKTVKMQKTGVPLNYLILAFLMVICGLILPKKK